jgi:hypothetical protein
MTERQTYHGLDPPCVSDYLGSKDSNKSSSERRDSRESSGGLHVYSSGYYDCMASALEHFINDSRYSRN